jgi:hypothetical protein
MQELPIMYNGMHNMFKNKRVKTIKKPNVVEPKVVNSLVHNECQHGHYQE